MSLKPMKTLAVLAAAALSLTACGSNTTPGETVEPAPPADTLPAETMPVEPTDAGETTSTDDASAPAEEPTDAGSEPAAGEIDPGPMKTVELEQKDTYTIGYSQANNAEPYRAQLNIQLEYFVGEQDNLELLPIADAAQDSSRQVSQVQQFITQGVDILIVSPNESDPLTPPVQQACDAGIPVIVLDRTVNTDCIAAFIGGDNVAIGRAAGELALELLPDGGTVVELRGILSNQPQIDRDQGFRDAIAENPDIEIVKDQEAKWVKEEGTKVMQQWLQSGEQIDLVYAHNDPMALGAYLAAAAAGQEGDIAFIGIDGLAIPDGGIRAVEQGQLDGTFIYPTGAKEAVDTVMKMIAGEEFGSNQTLPTEAVTKDNAAEVYERYDFSNR